MNERRASLHQRVTVLRARGWVPRVCLYALTAESLTPNPSFQAVRGLAVRESWQVGAEQTFADRCGSATPVTRPGWAGVQHQVRAGFADGVVVVTQADISLDHDEYEGQLGWFAEHCGFIALVHLEAPAGLR